jgi:hypothetical protein
MLYYNIGMSDHPIITDIIITITRARASAGRGRSVDPAAVGAAAARLRGGLIALLWAAAFWAMR